MTSLDFIRELALVWPPWADVVFTERDLPYIVAGELAGEIRFAILDGKHLNGIIAVLECVERALGRKDPELTNLVAVGLFEPLQSHAVLRFEPPDLLDDRLGPRAKALWGDLVEGATEPGIRSIEGFRAFLGRS